MFPAGGSFEFKSKLKVQFRSLSNLSRNRKKKNDKKLKSEARMIKKIFKAIVKGLAVFGKAEGGYLVMIWFLALTLALSGCVPLVKNGSGTPNGNLVSNNLGPPSPSPSQSPTGTPGPDPVTFVPPSPYYCYGDSSVNPNWNPGVTNQVTTLPQGDFMYISQIFTGSGYDFKLCEYKIQDLATQTDYVLYCASYPGYASSNNENLIPGWTVTTVITHPDAGSFGCYFILTQDEATP